MSEKAKKDLAVYNVQMQKHNEHYRELRQEYRNMGYRITRVFSRIKEKEVRNEYSGPELPIVIKGNLLQLLKDLLGTF